jgi:hypothetical protein
VGAAPAGPTVTDSLDLDTLTLLRYRCRYDAAFNRRLEVVAFGEHAGRISRLPLEDAVQADLIGWATARWPRIDWSLDHDVRLACGHVGAAPEAWEGGFIPEDDGTFGSRRPAVLLSAEQAAWDAPRPWPRAARIDWRRAA